MKKTVLISGILAISQIYAQVIPGINSKSGAMTVPEKKVVLGIKHIYFERKNMFEGSDEVYNKEDLNAKANITMMILRYGLSKRSDVRLVIPYKNLKAKAKLGPNNVEIDNKGIGDLLLIGKYILMPMQKYGYQLSIEAGIKFPTGDTDKDFKKAPPFAKNVHTPLPTQMGTGEAEYKIGLGYSKVYDNAFRVDVHTMFTYRPKAKNDYEFGNEWTFDVSAIKAINQKINIGLEYNFKYNSKTDMGDDTNALLRSKLPFKAFSGNAGYITPQIHFLPFGKPKLHISTGISFLAHYNLKEYQPLEKRKYIIRIGYLF